MDTILTLEQFKANIEVYNFFNGSYYETAGIKCETLSAETQ